MPTLPEKPRGEPVAVELVPVEHVCRGDVLDLGDGTRAEVTDIRHGDYRFKTGHPGASVAVGWRSGSSSGVLFRRLGETLYRVPR